MEVSEVPLLLSEGEGDLARSPRCHLTSIPHNLHYKGRIIKNLTLSFPINLPLGHPKIAMTRITPGNIKNCHSNGNLLRCAALSVSGSVLILCILKLAIQNYGWSKYIMLVLYIISFTLHFQPHNNQYWNFWWCGIRPLMDNSIFIHHLLGRGYGHFYNLA